MGNRKAGELKDMIEEALSEIPETRNSDILLTITIWKMFYPDSVIKVGDDYCVKCHELYDLPREDEVKRLRAVIQNVELRYPPTEWAVAKKRKWKEYQWRVLLNHE